MPWVSGLFMVESQMDPYGMEDPDMMDQDMYGDEDQLEGDPMDNSGQYGQEQEYGDEHVSYNFQTAGRGARRT